MNRNNIVCKGLLCRKTDRKYKSYISGKRGCGLCMIKTSKGHVTTDEFLTSNEKHILKKRAEFDNDFNLMIKDLFKNNEVNKNVKKKFYKSTI